MVIDFHMDKMYNINIHVIVNYHILLLKNFIIEEY